MVDRLVQQMADIARTLQHGSRGDTAAVLADITKHACSEIPGAQHVSITVAIDGERLETPARIQQRHLEGPRLSAATERRMVVIDDIATDKSWPKYRRDVLAESPVRSIMSFAFGNDAQEIGLVFATHAALAWDT